MQISALRFVIKMIFPRFFLAYLKKMQYLCKGFAKAQGNGVITGYT
jgi:hypothetical protein